LKWRTSAAVPAVIELFHVYKSYGQEPVLFDLNFGIEKGESVFLTGPSGAGKTTLLRILGGLEPVSRGQLLYLGKSLAERSNREFLRFRQSVGFVFQDYKLLPTRSIAENVAFPLEVRGFSSRDIRSRVNHLLHWVGLEHKARVLPERLSGGEQQRVAIARALAADPALLLADEPTGNLDPELAMGTMRLFDDAHARGVTVVIATHDIAMVERYSRRVIHIQAGRTRGPVVGMR
jgi:cell division transport system ATP-binding protein